MKEIPNSWIWTTIGKVGVVVSGGTPSTKQLEYWKDGTIPWITPADLSKYNEKYISKGKRNITQEGLDYSSAKLLPKGTVLFSSRAPIGYTVIAKNELATNQGFKNLITTKSLSSDYVYYYFKTLKESAEKVASGTTFLELSATKFSKLPFPLAPLDEQKRIVLKIEELLSELAYIKKNSLQILEDIESYRYKILEDVFNQNSKSRRIIKVKDLGEISTGTTPHKKKLEYYGDEYCFYKPSDFNRYNKISTSKEKLSLIGYTKSRKVPKNSILIVSIGNTIGKIALVKKEGAFNQQIHAIVPNKHYLSEFIFYQTISIKFQNLLKSNSSATTIPIINKSKFSELNFISFSLEIQEKIVLEIEQKFSLIDNLKSTIETAIKEIDILRTKILDNAFKGKLVDNITNENAKDLLKQIQLEKSEYLKKEQKIQKKRVKKRKIMSNNLSIIEILEKAKKPILAKDLWQKSKHKNDIEEFYAELKSIENKIETKNKNRDSFIRIKNANK